MAYETTDVSVSNSWAELQKIFKKYAIGQSQNSESWGAGIPESNWWVAVEFYFREFDGLKVHRTLRVRFVGRPNFNNMIPGPRCREGKRAQLEEQEHRRVWRVLVHHIKAKLIAVEEGLVAFEEEFLPYLVIGNFDGAPTVYQELNRIGLDKAIDGTAQLALPGVKA